MSTDKVTVMPPKPGEQKEYYIDWRNPPKKGDPHKEIDMYLSRQDTVYWYCDKKFRVKRVDPDPDENPKAPHPFYRLFPEDNLEWGFQVNSGPLRPEAVRPEEGKKDYLYKPVFEFEDDTPDYDPHIRTHK
jgi:hypothetical protein